MFKYSPANPNYFPSSESKAAQRLRAKTDRFEELVAKNADEEIEWAKAYAARQDAGLEDDSAAVADAFVFKSASVLHSAKVLHQRLQLNNAYKAIYGCDNNNLTSKIYEDPCSAYLLNSEKFGLSLSDIFDQGEELVRKDPTSVYGFMLRSSTPPGDETGKLNGSYSFVAVTAGEAEAVTQHVKQHILPSQMASTLLELSGLYQKAWSRVKSGFFSPDSPLFPAVVEMGREIMENGHPNQVRTFLEQMVGLGTFDNGRVAYRTMSALVLGDAGTEFYQDYLSIIENSFDGIAGEEMYDLLGTERHDGAQADFEMFSHAQRQMQQFLGVIKDNNGIIELDAGQYGELDLDSPRIHYKKNKAHTYVALEASIVVSSGETVPLTFRIGKENSFSWSFLKDQEQVPELFDIVVVAMNEAMRMATTDARRVVKPGVVSVIPTNVTRSNGHYKDEIYKLRKDERRRDKEQPSLQELNVESSDSGNESDSSRLPLILPEHKAAALDPATLSQAELIIEKYTKGLINLKKLDRLSEKGRTIFRLKSGDTRLLVELRDGYLEVIDGGDRKDIYPWNRA